MWQANALLLIALLTFVPAMEAEQGHLDRGPAAAWAVPLSVADLDSRRGGIAGVAFSVYFTAYFDNTGSVTGNLIVDNGRTTTPAPPPEIRMENGQVMISTVIGDFNGASGIFQITQVPGSFHVVHNNLFVQIAVVNVLNGAAVPSLSSLFRPTP
jgi:hypothetical protein